MRDDEGGNDGAPAARAALSSTHARATCGRIIEAELLIVSLLIILLQNVPTTVLQCDKLCIPCSIASISGRTCTTKVKLPV
jgi:hypothetical protein